MIICYYSLGKMLGVEKLMFHPHEHNIIREIIWLKKPTVQSCFIFNKKNPSGHMHPYLLFIFFTVGVEISVELQFRKPGDDHICIYSTVKLIS